MNARRAKTGGVGVRIGGGAYRGRMIAVPDGLAVRPTAARVRESLFNVLAHNDWQGAGGPLPRGARVLDAFAGAGALGLEALSRGALEVLLLEPDKAARAAVNANIDALDAAGRAFVLPRDATKPGPMPGTARFGLVLADAPYGSGLGAAALSALAAAGWLADGAVAVVELDGREPWAAPDGFTEAVDRRYGRTRLVFVEWRAAG